MKDIPGYEKLYAIEENGEVYSYKSKKYLKQSINEFGYYYVKITENKKQKRRFIHRLLALTYIPNPNNYPTVDHIDRNTTNNTLNNLRWADNKIQNHNSSIGDKNFKNNQCPVEMREKNNHNILIKTFNDCCEAAILMFNDKNKNSLINRCARGKKQSAYGYYWTFIRKGND